MNKIKGLTLVIGALFTGMALAQSTRPAASDENLPRLWQPYSRMTTLDRETHLKIDARHDETLAAIREIEAQERADILAMLNDEQKAELSEIEATMAAERDEYVRERRQRRAAEQAEQPADAE